MPPNHLPTPANPCADRSDDQPLTKTPVHERRDQSWLVLPTSANRREMSAPCKTFSRSRVTSDAPTAPHAIQVRIVLRWFGNTEGSLDYEGWASWNLGIFLCVRCASLHRKMGTHISKVKSMSMDTWAGEHVEVGTILWETRPTAKYTSEYEEEW